MKFKLLIGSILALSISSMGYAQTASDTAKTNEGNASPLTVTTAAFTAQAVSPSQTLNVMAPTPTSVSVSDLTKRFNSMMQNKDNPKGGPDWMDMFHLGGLLNLDAFDETKPEFGKNGQSRRDDLSIATTKLNIDADVNDWVNGHVGLFYSDTDSRYYRANDVSTDGIRVDEAYAKIANFNTSPFYLQAGQQYLPFGHYDLYPITKTLTQELSETRDVSGVVGFVDKSGFSGSLYTLDGLKRTNHSNHDSLSNYGAALDFSDLNHVVTYDVGLDYLNNMIDVGEISFNLANSTYVRRVGAIAAYGEVAQGPFSFGVDYVTALTRFSTTDLSWQPRLGTTKGAQPRAGTVETSYAFPIAGHDSKLTASYQLTRQAHNVNGATNALNLPKYRYSLACGSMILKNTIVAVEYRRDKDYPPQNGGTNSFDNALILRLTLLLM